MRRFGSRIFNWLYSDGSFRTFISRYLRFFGIYLVFALTVNLLTAGLGTLNGHLEGKKIVSETVGTILDVTSMVICIVLNAFIFVFPVIMLAGIVVILAEIGLFLLSLFLRMSEFLAWKAVEYNKGVWAVITAFMTVLLGIIAVLFHHQVGS